MRETGRTVQMNINRQILLDSLPEDKISEANYRLGEAPVPEPGPGEVLCRTLAINIAAGTRAALQGSAGYMGAPEIGMVMWGEGVARVSASEHPDFATGDVVLARTNWQDYSVQPAKGLTKLPPGDDPVAYLGALGTNGLTAYFGLLDVGRPQEGETVLVSSAAGSVGHLVGQMARIKGCRAVGVTGSDTKGEMLTTKLGFDAAVSYRDDDFRKALKAASPDGVDVYFDNTGGPILESALFRMNKRGRIVCCGVVSQYDTSSPGPGPRGVPGLLVGKRLQMAGFLIFDYADRYEQAREEIRGWLSSGRLVNLTDEFEGLEEAPRAFVDLLAGGNIGTRIVRVSD
jgi:NADPH-dependent curcumin reductase CurA